ncbi:MAG: hypothetical protein FVQ83_09800 [Chloroflexi bacterium]|nr:hypothetical protein [Chloroflexota bacterium]
MTTSTVEPDFHWRKIWLGYGLSVVISLVIGLPLTIAFENSWWLAWVGVAGLFISSLLVARQAKTGEPLNGAMIALLYFGTFAVIYLVGQTLELLPDPLPGLAADDSTFSFVWPLAQIIAGTAGSLVGGIGLDKEAE